MTETTAQKKPKKTRPAGRPSLTADQIYSRREAALAAGVAAITLIRAHDNGHLQAYRVGRIVRHSGKQLIDWLEGGGKTGHHTTRRRNKQ